MMSPGDGRAGVSTAIPPDLSDAWAYTLSGGKTAETRSPSNLTKDVFGLVFASDGDAWLCALSSAKLAVPVPPAASVTTRFWLRYPNADAWRVYVPGRSPSIPNSPCSFVTALCPLPPRKQQLRRWVAGRVLHGARMDPTAAARCEVIERLQEGFLLLSSMEPL